MMYVTYIVYQKLNLQLTDQLSEQTHIDASHQTSSCLNVCVSLVKYTKHTLLMLYKAVLVADTITVG